jgi:DnaJ-domain-containing protein 1
MSTWIQKYTLEIFVALCTLLIFFLWRSGQSSKSQFRVKEHERSPSPTASRADGLAQSRFKSSKKIALPGICIDGAAHEVLGVTSEASKREILEAYKRLMKQYHPDQVAAPGSDQWKEAQKIAIAINAAKEKLLRSRS